MEDKNIMIKGELQDPDLCISHENSLWYFFRMLAEEMEVPDRIGQNVMRAIGGNVNDT